MPPTVPTLTPTVAPPRTPPQGTLRVAVTGALPHRDMHRVVSEWATLYGPGPSYGRLMKFSLGAEGAPSLAVQCDLCESWRIVDELTFEFDVDPAAAWQPGENLDPRPVTPQDVVFSMNRLRTPGFPHAVLLDSVAKVEPVSERTVRFSLRFPDPDLPLALASPYAVIMAPGALNRVDARTGRVIGAGPWLFEQGASGQATLKAWDDHPLGTAVQRVEFLLAANQDLTVRLLRLGRADAAHVPNVVWPELEAEGFRSMVVERQGRGVLFGMNSRRAPFDDLGLRQAVLAGLDLQAALDDTFGIGSVGSGVPLLDEAWGLDAEEASLLFGPSAPFTGSEPPPPFTLTVANFGETHVAHGETLAQQLRDAGFDVEVEVVTRAAYLRRVWEERDFDAFVGPMPPTDMPNDFLLGLAHSRGSANVTGGDDELDELIVAIAVELDPATRADLVRSAQRLLIERGYFVMAASSAERWAFDARVEGFVPDMPMGAGDLWSRVGVAVDPEDADSSDR